MSEVTPQSHKKNEGNHDDCSDCVRQKKENEAFIKIYERLQDVHKRTSQVRQAVSHHKNSSDTNRSFYRSYQQKLINLPKAKDKYVSAQTMQAAGYQIAASIIEKESKSQLIAQNTRLKELLSKMQQQKQAAYHEADSLRDMLPGSSRTYPHMRDSLTHSFNIDPCSDLHESFSLKKENSFRLEGMREELDKLTNSQETSESCKQNGSTQSSNFTMRMRNSMDMSKYNDLNLWLYQSEKNARLEEELFIQKELKPKSMINKPIVSKTVSTKK